MRLTLTDAWRERLARIREAQIRELPASWFTGFLERFGAEVILLRAGWGNSAHLALDGRLFWWSGGEGLPPRLIETAIQAADAITWAVEPCRLTPGFPELVELLPPPPPGAKVCRGCGGGGWVEWPDQPGGLPTRQRCPCCRALGWVEPRAAEPSAATDRAGT